ncbi:P-loop containing nucleoside triphosphate hydrolase protein [Thelephora terrestris]|uniref:RNA helicase n=1 Tax=Thelephora terrestris TaxID=56493 RepID=A0A9P6HDQ5_9AGAM|nr:P-loop containing nucleoside triphosphate hydrolase protein [Thelephora terrestris]
MDRQRERYNARARQSAAGGASHKRRKRKNAGGSVRGDAAGTPTAVILDPNAEIINLKPLEQKELEKRERVRQQMAIEAGTSHSRKKKKKLEKYIEKKLKQEERVTILAKLSKSQAELSSLNLKSSATLGTGRISSHKEILGRQEDKEVRRISKKTKLDPMIDEDSGDEDHSYLPEPTKSSRASPEEQTRRSGTPDVRSVFERIEPPAAPVSVGSALRKNTDGSVSAPKVLAKRNKGSKLQSWKRKAKESTPPQAETEDSFDSSDSAYDSSDTDQEESEVFEDRGEGEGEDKDIEDEEEMNDRHYEGDDGGDHAEESDRPRLNETDRTRTRGRGAFKRWALEQLSNAKPYVVPAPEEEAIMVELPEQPPSKKRKIEHTSGLMRGPLGEDYAVPSSSFARAVQDSQKFGKKTIVDIQRPPEVAAARLLLPIISEEQQIVETILLNPVTIIYGETGSGKTTQVPQFLYEAGFAHPDGGNPGMIGITQPRRVAAVSMANRVAQELPLSSSRVSYQIRYDATTSPNTSIKFMTDGVLLRELSSDFLLRKYSVIIIDEAHERSMNTDILIGVLSRVLKLREEMWREGRDDIKPLRLVIMSATLRISDMAENKTLFATPPPTINVPGRQYPVTVHFSRRTKPDYVAEAVRKTTKIHNRLPPGGILIFLTGQNEITGVCRKLEARFGPKALSEKKRKHLTISDSQREWGGSEFAFSTTVSAGQGDLEAEDMDLGVRREELATDVDDGMDMDGSGNEEGALDSDSENEENGMEDIWDDVGTPMHIVPLYSLLPGEKQLRVFEPPPEGSRLVVVATNIAETSLTIPNIRYVVDCGRGKERRYDLDNGIQAFQVSWISKASATQRAGRAGRTGPGHCYRLYSSAVFENYFDEFSKPEILRMPIDGVVLQMKSMHIDAVVNFPFPTPPSRDMLLKSEKLLTHLGALQKTGTGEAQITDMGRSMALFPLSPRYSRMLISGKQHGCLPYVIAIVSALSVGEPFLHEEALNADDEDEHSNGGMDDELQYITNEKVKTKEKGKARRRSFFQNQQASRKHTPLWSSCSLRTDLQTQSALGNGSSDILRLLSAAGAYEYAGGGAKFCAENFVRQKAMEEIHKLRGQISNIVQANFSDADACFMPKISPPDAFQVKVLRQLLTAAFIDQVAVRKDLLEEATGNKLSTSKGVPYRTIGIEEDVFIHPSSVLFSASPPEYLVYHEMVRSSQVWIKGNNYPLVIGEDPELTSRAAGLTQINPSWIFPLAKSLCTFSNPIRNKDGVMMVIPRYGPGWELPPVRADSI